VTRVVREAVLDAGAVEALLRARKRVVEERPRGQGRYELARGPLTHYRRTVVLERLPDGRSHVTQTVEYRLAIPFFGWLFAPAVKRVLGRLGGGEGPEPWWAPPDRLDARAASVLGVLAAASLVAGYLGTLITQTITFAAREFGSSEADEGVALASVRVSILLALVLVTAADRQGRRRLLLSAGAGIVMAATGALAPSLPWLAASQIGARSFSIALSVLIGVVAAEEMPAGARAYAASVLAMAAALGAGACVAALPLADVAERAWRGVYLVPLLALPLVVSIARHLRESRRFEVPHRTAPMAGHGRRFWLLGISFFLVTIFSTPASQFLNEFLRTERGWSASRIALFTIATNTPGGIGVIVGGRLADVRGRRVVAAVGLVGGTAATVIMFLSSGWPLWAWSIVGAVVGAVTIPALSVYGPELFPTSLRGRANGGLAVLGVLGSVTGLLTAGFLADHVGGLGHAIPLLAVGPVVVAVLVLTRYPETAHLELEDLNPEDRPTGEPSP
jgi:MFS family permease